MGGMEFEQFARWDREHVWHAFTQMQEYEPWLIVRAEGCELIDVQGRRWLDGVSSLWCNIHGHNHPKLNRAICDQLEKVAHVTSLGMGNLPAAELAYRLVQLAPPGLEHVFFSGDGACAVEAALKIAFQYWQQCHPSRPSKTRFVAFEDAYHGDTLGAASVGGVARFHALFRPLLFEVFRLPVPDSYRRPKGMSLEEAAGWYLEQLERLLRSRHQEIAAVIIEPLMQCAAGMVRHPPGFLAAARRITQQYDVLLIADEVAVGFGRTGTMFACQQENVAPDILCLGKGLTAGYLPMSATLVTDDIYQAFLGDYGSGRMFYHGHTYAGNPLAAAVALASLEIFEEEHVLEQLPPKCRRLEEHLARIAELPVVGDVRQCGLMAGIELVKDKVTGEPFAWHERVGWQVCQRAKQRNVFLRPLGSVIVIMPPLAIRHEQIDQLMEAVYEAIEEFTRQTAL
ncbi:MAG: adenosylmethionine-8-amino-7-oxononanoate aminotransferase [Pirellulaceae bacterium]|nr:MAG: adenosylmethionine-8-amino-7-oxononanoate aminotransferase [Pirellulaceae bacterium]